MKNTNSRRKPQEPEQPFSWKAELLSWIQVLATAAVIAFVLNTFIIANSQVPSASMEDTIMTGDRVIGSRLAYRFGQPDRGDVAIFVFGYSCRNCRAQYQENAQGVCPNCGRSDRRNSVVYYVKRVIGLPGDVIDIRDGHVYLNGSEEPYDEPYLTEDMETPYPLHFEVPEGGYFMMGDNRNYSLDARFWDNPYISEDKILAKVLFRYFPRISLIK